MRSLRERDGDIVNNWYIACKSKKLKSKPYAFKMYDMNLVLIRTKNGLACFEDKCLHRHSLLSAGTIENGQIKCPYHGWTYDTEGLLTNIPSRGPEAVKGKRCLKRFQVHEKQGVIWVFMGEYGQGKLEDIWDFPYMGDKGWHGYIMVTDFENEVTHLAENFMDVPHTVYVHKGWFRNESKKKIHVLTETFDSNVLVTYEQPSDEIGVLIRKFLNPKNEKMFHTDRFIYPNITRVDYKFGSHYQYVINSQMSPISTMKTRVYTYIGYKIGFVGRFIKPFLNFYTKQVINQDVWIMKVQSENLKNEENPRFQSTDSDHLHIQVEKLRDFGAKSDERLLTHKFKSETEIWI